MSDDEKFFYEGRLLAVRDLEAAPRLAPLTAREVSLPQNKPQPRAESSPGARLPDEHYRRMLRVHEEYLDAQLQAHTAYLSLLQKAAFPAPRPAERPPGPSRNFSAIIPEFHTRKTSFSTEEILSYRSGAMGACFGEEFRWTATHTRTPRRETAYGHLERILEFDPGGGRLRAEGPAPLPGEETEAFLDALAFYMTGLGFTMYRDGWLFEAAPGNRPARTLQSAATGTVQYEFIVDEITEEPLPALYARALCSSESTLICSCERIGLRLVPGWPLTTMRHLIEEDSESRPTASYGGIRFEYTTVLNSSLGKPSLAFGDRYAICDNGKRYPRFPAPPYLFVSRISELRAEPGRTDDRPSVTTEYDIPADAWYFKESGNGNMPYSVLMETAMQPCGWLAVFTMSDDQIGREYLFRALDGTAVQQREITPRDRRIRSEVTLLSAAQTGEMIIERFEIHSSCGDEEVYSMQAVFGFCSPGSVKEQKGLPVTPSERELVGQPSDLRLELSSSPARYYLESSARMPSGRLRMLDRITAYLPKGGKSGRGYLRAEKDIAFEDWFFKAHFMQDPVQPGSLGLEAVLQLMKFHMLHNNRHAGMGSPRFEPLINGEIEWHYRGQVTPDKKRIVVDLDILDEGTDFVSAEARLWVDGLKIYHFPQIGVRLRDDAPASFIEDVRDWSLALKDHPWLQDHKPTYTLPAVPLTYEIEMMALAARELFPEKKLTVMDKVAAKRWMSFGADRLSGRTIVKRDGDSVHAELQVCSQPQGTYETCATGVLGFADSYPQPEAEDIPPLKDGRSFGCPYREHRIFHGPSFQLMSNWTLGSNGARCCVDARSRGVPYGMTHPGFVDAALHCVPIDNLWLWDSAISKDSAVYPLRMEGVRFYSDLPHEGIFDVEARYVRLDHGFFPAMRMWILNKRAPIASFTWVGVMMPKGTLGSIEPGSRVAFLRDRRFVPGAWLSGSEGGRTILRVDDVKKNDWLPGSVASLYGLDRGLPLSRMAQAIAAKEHMSRRLWLHAGKVEISQAGGYGNTPINTVGLAVEEKQGCIAVSGEVGKLRLDGYDSGHSELNKIETGAFFEDMEKALIDKFVRRLVLEDVRGFRALKGKPILYLANHQTGVESLLFACLMRWQGAAPINTLAKMEHRTTWLGKIDAYCKDVFGDAAPMAIVYIDRGNPISIFRLLKSFSARPCAARRSLLVHVEGTRSLNANHAVTTISSVLLDLAVDAGLPIVPVRFSGGLPFEGNTQRLEFPAGYGRQDIYLGAPISASTLKDCYLKDRTDIIADGINRLGPVPGEERPLPGDPAFASRTAELQDRYGLPEVKAVIAACLLRYHDARPETKEFLVRLLSNRVDISAIPKDSPAYKAAQFIRT